MNEPDAPNSVSGPSCRVHWYDGVNALRHEGVLALDGEDALRLEEAGKEARRIAPDDLEFIERRGERCVYRLGSNRDFRLTVPADPPAPIAALLPDPSEYGRWIDKLGLAKAAAIFALISALVAAAVITAPDWLGPRIPPSVERRIGDAMIGDLGNRICHTPQSDAALARLTRALDPERPVARVGIAKIDMVNAVALPGGQVLIFDGLVQQAQSPEELAGVIAHEIGHVRKRHVMTAILRQFGLSILLAGANSSSVHSLAGIATLGYSRKAESQADAFARERLAQNRISPLGAARFFERMAKMTGDDGEGGRAVLGWLATHPSPKNRARAFRQSARGARFAPALSQAEFEAIKQACARDPNAKPFELF